MRAALCERYGPPDVVRVADVRRPTPRPSDVLVRVKAAAVTSGDARIRGARYPRGYGALARLAFGVRGPRRPILGNVFSGVVEQVGAKVHDFSPGQRVCGMTGSRMGAHAEYVATRATRIAHLPRDVSHEEAAGILFGGTTALHFLHTKADVQLGARVLVNGASGAVGTAAVQLASHAGAVVTGVTSARNADLVRWLGASRVIDHTTASWDEVDERFDVVLDAVGTLDLGLARGLLDPSGVLLLPAADLPQTLAARGRAKTGVSPEDPADFARLLDLVAAGHLEPVVDARDGLESIAASYAVVDSGHKVGNLVVRP